jgi:hypothetical protein
MAKTKEPKVTLKIISGKSTPAQLAAWQKLWRKLITDANIEMHK